MAFSFLSTEEIEILCSYLQLREWQADAVVMSEGAAEDYVGFLLEGKLAVKKKAGYPCRLLTLSAPKMDELTLNNPLLAVKLMKRMLFIMSIRLRKASDRISELL
jgi:CRP-like cAMP-binding protein